MPPHNDFSRELWKLHVDTIERIKEQAQQNATRITILETKYAMVGALGGVVGSIVGGVIIWFLKH